MKRGPRCSVPDCPRYDLAEKSELCLGHDLLWQRSPLLFSTKPRGEALAAFFEGLSHPKHKNGNGAR